MHEQVLQGKLTGTFHFPTAAVFCDTHSLWQALKENAIIERACVTFALALLTNCNKFYCNLSFYKLNTYLILTSACLVLWSKNVSTDKNFLRNILVTRGDPFVCACPRLRSSRCRQKIVESSSLYFWSPENKLCGEVGWVYPCEDKVSI